MIVDDDFPQHESRYEKKLQGIHRVGHARTIEAVENWRKKLRDEDKMKVIDLIKALPDS